MVYSAINIIQISFYSFIFIFGTIGNAFVVRWFGVPSEIGKAGNKLVVILAINDFLSSIFVPLHHIHRIVSKETWHIRKALCALLGLYYTFLFATSFLLVAISIERFRYVFLKSIGNKREVRCKATSWMTENDMFILL